MVDGLDLFDIVAKRRSTCDLKCLSPCDLELVRPGLLGECLVNVWVNVNQGRRGCTDAIYETVRKEHPRALSNERAVPTPPIPPHSSQASETISLIVWPATVTRTQQ